MPDKDSSGEEQIPASVMQFFFLLHSLRPRDPLWVSAQFLHALADVVFPVDGSEVCVLPWIYGTRAALSVILH